MSSTTSKDVKSSSPKDKPSSPKDDKPKKASKKKFKSSIKKAPKNGMSFTFLMQKIETHESIINPSSISLWSKFDSDEKE